MKITPLKMWVQNVLPVVYDDSLSYYEMVGKINEKTNEIINQVNENTDGIESLNYVIQQLGDVDELKALLEEVETIVDDLYSADTPEMDSTNGSAGVSDHAARSDHSHPSDSSKADVSLGIDGALAGQYVKIKTVEAGVPTEFENGMPHEVPSGGTTGQALRKESNGDYAVDWGDVHEVPNGGTTGQALRKESNGDYAVDWGDVHEVPNGGTTGQIFRKNSNTNYDAGWSDEHGIPTGGTNNDILVKNGTSDYSAKWTNTPVQMGSLAFINTGTTADKLYNPGEYLVYNGQLYKATEAISQDQTLNPSQGGNITATSVTQEINKQWTLLVNDTTTPGANYNKTFTVNIPVGTRDVLCSLQRASNGRTIGATILPYSQFSNGGAYVGGSYVLYDGAMNNNANTWINAVFLHATSNSIEVACANPTESIRVRVFAR